MRAEDPVSGHVGDDSVEVSQRVPFCGRMWMNRLNWYSFAGPPSLPLGEMVIHWKSGAFPKGPWKHEYVHLYLLTGLTTCAVAQRTNALCSIHVPLRCLLSGTEQEVSHSEGSIQCASVSISPTTVCSTHYHWSSFGESVLHYRHINNNSVNLWELIELRKNRISSLRFNVKCQSSYRTF